MFLLVLHAFVKSANDVRVAGASKASATEAKSIAITAQRCVPLPLPTPCRPHSFADIHKEIMCIQHPAPRRE